MASVRLVNNKWHYRITCSINGKKKYIERGGFKTREEAICAGEVAELDFKKTKQLYSRTTMLFSDLATEWIDVHGPNVYKETTIQGYKKELRSKIIPQLKNYEISSITPKMCQNIITDGVNSGVTRNRLNRIRACVRRCFDYALRSGYISSNPAKDIYIPYVRAKAAAAIRPPRKHRVISRTEADAIFTRFPEGHSDYIPLLLGYRCGLRLGEAFGLLVEDIDLNSGCLHIRRQIQYDETNNKLYFTQPKYCNPEEYRDVVVDDDTLRILKRHINKINKCFIPLEYPQYYIDKNGYLSTKCGERIQPVNVRIADGTFIGPRTMQNVSRIIHGKTSDFKNIDPLWDFHCMRHTHASDCIAAGMSPVSVQMRLGHKNLQTTYRYYIHETETQVTESRAILKQMY
ncbi:site-specific integrase [Lachnoclostridium sp. Marseille-P6806]|uniref:site-specific integrase n=1 Tax=Lachnoclostridium sp. Marseille-P6806 TaxID=2364793 RepID=UPI0010323B2D|nr:tyrosine-type recombinase/integrase [Lachnoclostridium sp. Marseille-P6806]